MPGQTDPHENIRPNFYYPIGFFRRDRLSDLRTRVLGYFHVEAFALMCYASKDGRQREQLWNSRDGVTPYDLIARDKETELFHVDWQLDVCVPFLIPPVGMRVFVDLTEEAAREYVVRQVARDWNHPEYPMSERWETKAQAIEDLTDSHMERPGQPHVVTVTEELQRRFAGVAATRVPYVAG